MMTTPPPPYTTPSHDSNAVLLQPMRADPPPGAKCKDKFLVQSAIIDASQEHLALAEIVRPPPPSS